VERAQSIGPKQKGVGGGRDMKNGEQNRGKKTERRRPNVNSNTRNIRKADYWDSSVQAFIASFLVRLYFNEKQGEPRDTID